MRYHACLSCGASNVLSRGLCHVCYQRAYLQRLHTNYPACGAVPVPHRRDTTPHACLSCGVDDHAARGLCHVCYRRAHRLGISAQYPACGAVPVPQTGQQTTSAAPKRCQCGAVIQRQSTRCRACFYRALRDVERLPQTAPASHPRLRAYPDQPAIIGATSQPDWLRAVAWESRPQRWETLRHVGLLSSRRES